MNRLWDGRSEADVDFAQMAAMSTDCLARVTQSLREASREDGHRRPRRHTARVSNGKRQRAPFRTPVLIVTPTPFNIPIIGHCRRHGYDLCHHGCVTGPLVAV